jgi:cytochrome c oxidase subunit 2
VADEQYLRESILYPQNALVQGYPAIMPTFQGQISEDDLVQLIAYLKSLSDEQGNADTP